MYDVSRPDTLRHLEEQWMQELELYGTETDAVRMVVANKVDVVSADVQMDVRRSYVRGVSYLHGRIIPSRLLCSAVLRVPNVIWRLVVQLLG